MQKRVRYALPIVLAAMLGLAGCQTTPRGDGDEAPQQAAQSATAPQVEFYIGQQEADASMQEIRIPDGSLYLQRVPVLHRGDLEEAAAMADQEGNSYVGLRFNDAGARKLETVSRQNVGKLMALVVNNELVAAPRIQEPLDRGVLAFQVASDEDALAIASAIRGEAAAAEPAPAAEEPQPQ